MESEQRCYELRSTSRSRSQTPLIQTHALSESEVLEHHYDLRNRSRERSHTPGGSISSKKSASKSLPSNYGKVNDQTIETIMEEKEEDTSAEALFESRNKRTENSSASARKVERRSGRQKAKREILANGQGEKTDDSPGAKQQKKYNNPHRTVTSDYSSEEGEKEDLPNRPSTIHEIYKQAGDWWNVFPKTDYTYSKKSQCRYEIAPGILAMPNMSRRSIHSETDTFNHLTRVPSESGIYEATSFENNTESNDHEKSNIDYTKSHVERYRCHKEVVHTVPRSSTKIQSSQLLRSDSSLKSIDSWKYSRASCVDSDAELDDAVSASNKFSKNRKLTQSFLSFTAIISAWFNKLFEFVKLKTFRRREYYSPHRYESKWYKIWQHIDRWLQYVYLFMVKVLLFDSWLLSRFSNIRKWMQQRSPKILWIALLPLLFLTGSWCLPYFSTSFHSVRTMTRQLREASELFTVNRGSFHEAERFGRTEDFVSIVEELNNRISTLEDRTIEQTNRLLNISATLEKFRESDIVWSKFNNKMLLLDKTIEGQSLVDTYNHEIEGIKLQFETLKGLYSELKLCCNTQVNQISSDDLERRIETILAGYLNALVSKQDLMKAIQSAMLAVDEGDSGIARKRPFAVADDGNVTDDRVREIVRDALRIYDADKTGRVDYALESAGGQIISTRCTQRYDIKTRAFKVLAFTLYHENNNPRTVIQGNPIQPGACWAFQGFPGYLLIKLRSSIYISGFTVEHAPKSILPNGEMRSAPRKFNVWGFVNENDPDPVMFGDYEFAATDDNLQYFPVQNTTIETPYEFVELRVHSNYGQLEYTCLYRFRVHGRPV
ncbi:PREDICTED: uncharacterized protein LOC107193483 [Dufourea novaeangliae]|nr:PREDICTED: uncharacterized protein LOC107193483 [Dufourea novaeangliae]XP_015438421.1 PREDICTED: uncharacterized protein LOC107193483 [Dufourea novaeangliae]